jgi:hypothetical protein
MTFNEHVLSPETVEPPPTGIIFVDILWGIDEEGRRKRNRKKPI